MGKDVQPLQSVKTSILAELTVRSGLRDVYTKMMTLIKLLCSFIYRLCLVLIMLTFDHVVMRFNHATLTFAI